MKLNLWFMKINIKAKHLFGDCSDARLEFYLLRYFTVWGIGVHLHWLYEVITQ